jgi:taurine--2-oxoglutarate transaminase
MHNNKENLRERYKNSVFFPWSKQDDIEPIFIKHAEGPYLHLEDGSVLLDMKAQAFCANLGHNHRGMIDSLSKAAQEARVISLDTFCPHRLGAAEKLKELAPKSAKIELSKVFFTLGGAEANENAIKMARMFTKKHKIICRYRSYHGATLATINFSGDYRRIPFDNTMTGVVRFPDPYARGSGQVIDTVRLLEEIIEIEGPETIAAILLEGITGANGVFVPPKDYWPRIRKICDRHNIILIADEVLSGFYRTGKTFAVDHFNTVPDIMTLSKGLTAGYAPLGAVLVNNNIADYFSKETLWCGLTQYGNPLSCAAAKAAMDYYIKDKIEDNVKLREIELGQALHNIKEESKIVAEYRYIGLLAAIDLKKKNSDEALVPYRASGEDFKPAKILGSLLKKEGISLLVRYSTLIISPPLNISKDDLQKGMMGIKRAILALEKEI